MHVLENMMLRKALTALAFTMAFLLTPRAWVEESTPSNGVDSIPVDMLEHSEDCLWCGPALQPVDCDVESTDPASPDDDAADTAERIWLNPDAPPPESETTRPCIDRTPDDTRPSA